MGKKITVILLLLIFIVVLIDIYLKMHTPEGTVISSAIFQSESAAETGKEDAEGDAAEKESVEAADIVSEKDTAEIAEPEETTTEDAAGYDNAAGTLTDGKPVLGDKVVLGASLGMNRYPLLSAFGPRDNFGTAISSDHKGIDFGMDEHTLLCAPVDTVISYVGENDARGKWLVMYIGHGLYLEYQHLSEIYVYPGEVVDADTVICESGDTGISIMPHLHLEILVSPYGGDDIVDFEDDSIRTDPSPYLSMRAADFSYLY